MAPQWLYTPGIWMFFLRHFLNIITLGFDKEGCLQKNAKDVRLSEGLEETS